MKRLTLLRHAKSDWGDPARSDFDRPLNARGRKAAAAMGRAMRELGLAFDHVAASPAVRVVETLAGVSQGYGEPLAPRSEEQIYLATPQNLIEVIRRTPPEVQNLLLAGHNPAMHQLPLLLTQGTDGALRDELAAKYPTAALAEIELDVEQWSEVAQGTGRLTRFIRPHDLDPEFGSDD